jgi:hypothetical protein
MPQKAQQVDANLQKFVEHFRMLCDQSYQKRTNNDAVPWFRPPVDAADWDGDLQTKQAWIDLHKAFNTDDAEGKLEDTFDAGQDPGNSADTIVLTLMIDYAAQAERAFRARHQTIPRALAHYACREQGHGTEAGALKGASVEYFTSIIKQGSEA